jgi:hypothetical protein
MAATSCAASCRRRGRVGDCPALPAVGPTPRMHGTGPASIHAMNPLRHTARVPQLRIAQDPAADELLSCESLALLLGKLLDQHVRRRGSGMRRADVDRPHLDDGAGSTRRCSLGIARVVPRARRAPWRTHTSPRPTQRSPALDPDAGASSITAGPLFDGSIKF